MLSLLVSSSCLLLLSLPLTSAFCSSGFTLCNSGYCCPVAFLCDTRDLGYPGCFPNSAAPLHPGTSTTLNNGGIRTPTSTFSPSVAIPSTTTRGPPRSFTFAFVSIITSQGDSSPSTAEMTAPPAPSTPVSPSTSSPTSSASRAPSACTPPIAQSPPPDALYSTADIPPSPQTTPLTLPPDLSATAAVVPQSAPVSAPGASIDASSPGANIPASNPGASASASASTSSASVPTAPTSPPTSPTHTPMSSPGSSDATTATATQVDGGTGMLTITQPDGTVSTSAPDVVVGGGDQNASSTRATASSPTIAIGGSAPGLKGMLWTGWGIGAVVGVAAVGLGIVH